MSRRSKAETGTVENGHGSAAGADSSGERTPLLEAGGATAYPDAAGHHDHCDPRERSHALSNAGNAVGTCCWGSSLCGLKPLMRCCGLDKWWRGRKTRATDKDDLNIYRIQSLAILMSYFSVGIALELLSTPVAYYLIDDLGAESGVYTVWVILITLPWSFKVGYGFLSDCVPIGGFKRKPYMLIGWLVHILSNATLALMITPGKEWTIILSFISACGYLLSDVMTDAIVVEKTQKEVMSQMGNIQASGYIARYFGSALGAIGGAVLYNKDTWGWGLSISTLFWINGLVPLFLVLPLMPFLIEYPKAKDTLKKHTDELWALVQKKAVWRPMTFVYIYNVLMIPNGAWTNYLVETLDFSDWDIGVVNIASQVFAWLGLVAYKYWMVDMSWRKLYGITTFIAFVTSIMQLLLILGISASWGIPDLLFATGDEAAYNLILALQFLPITRMYAVMCPTGSEGTSYALLTTMSNVAYSVAYSIGDLLTGLGGDWDVSNSTLASGEMSGMWRLTVLTSCIAFSPIFLVWLLPANKQEQLELQRSSETSRLGGQIFVAVAAGSILFSIGQAIYELVDDV